MPRTKQKPAQPVAVDRKPKLELKHKWECAALAQRVQDGLKERLLSALDTFVEEAFPEEATFMIEVLNERDNKSGTHKSHEYWMPLFSAMENTVSGYDRYVILLKDEDMIAPVEEFIQSLEKTVENNPQALEKPKPRQPSEIRAGREKEVKYFAELFAEHATADDLYFLQNVFERWDAYQDYKDEDRPPSPITSAFQYEVNQSWLIPVPWEYKDALDLLGMMQQKSWLGDLLNWIAGKGADKLSPCLVASKAAGMQDAYDKATADAA